VTRALELAAEGLTREAIASRLTAEGYRPRGRRWHKTTVQRMIARARMHGGPPPCPASEEISRTSENNGDTPGCHA